MIAQAAPGRYFGKLDGLAYVLQEGGREPAPDSVPVPSSPIVLRRGQPVAINVVNRMRAPTAVHWHGMELPSYADGVPAWSGEGNKLAPTIAPGDSFTAAFTPPRAGTFIYHSHTNELFQLQLGLYGPLLVVDPETYDPARERVFILGGNGPEGWGYGTLPKGEPPARMNGKAVPDTARMTAGVSYRLRLIQIQPDYSTQFTLRQGERTLQWRALAKDGADLPPTQRVMQPATLLAGPGETADFEFRPAAPGVLMLEVKARGGEWTMRVPIRVERAAVVAAVAGIPSGALTGNAPRAPSPPPSTPPH
jgi:FtsP/CotA-like multicopper oxidase with cupredoxin domain